MIKGLVERQIVKKRDLILREARRMGDLMSILMKRNNTGVEWTEGEIHRMKSHMLRLSLYVPVLIVFALPFGSPLLPILADTLDMRRKNRLNVGETRHTAARPASSLDIRQHNKGAASPANHRQVRKDGDLLDCRH